MGGHHFDNRCLWYTIMQYHQPISALLQNETVQIEIGLSEYSGNKKAVWTDGLLAKHQN
jgi:hypothetical protein